jgi:sialic acid synthase SpsE
VFLAKTALHAETSSRPLHISTGGADIAEIDAALKSIHRVTPGLEVILYHCVSDYPLSSWNAKMADLVRLDVLARKYQDKLNIRVGWSDHSRNVGVVLRSFAVFGSAVEVHVDLDDGLGAESRHGHCWNISELMELGTALKGFHDCMGRGEPVKIDSPDLRADPEDGLRPLKKYR